MSTYTGVPIVDISVDRHRLLTYGVDRDLNHVPDASYQGLTDREFANGWHFCFEWDGLLIHPSWPEAECCRCILADEYPS
jgi:hypothetical protein